MFIKYHCFGFELVDYLQHWVDVVLFTVPLMVIREQRLEKSRYMYHRRVWKTEWG